MQRRQSGASASVTSRRGFAASAWPSSSGAWFEGQVVADSSAVVQVAGAVRVVFDSEPQSRHPGLHGVRVAVEVRSPHLGKQLRLTEDLPRMLEKKGEKVELLGA